MKAPRIAKKRNVIKILADTNALKARLNQLKRRTFELQKTFEGNFPKYPSSKFEDVREFNIKLINLKARLNHLTPMLTRNRKKVSERIVFLSKDIQNLQEANKQLSNS
ncbi:hypothetical protein [Zobellia galactanivorans]|nr:hypothetical protein [Zobellia galactanivorans]